MRISTLRRSFSLTLLLVGFIASLVYAQERTVTGKVTSAEEGPLPGVNVILQGTGTGTVSDIDGNYSLVVPGPEAVLVFSSIGYTTEAITVGSQTVIDLVLAQDVTSLKEIVVTGYASQQKQDLTGSVGVVKAKELVQMPQGNVTQQLQGRVAGVTVTQDSRPGQNAKVRIRGFGSFYNNNPLYIVDGVPTTDINSLSPDDVESLTVLKDAGAASIYGSRASNGVIVVTTKQGSKGIKVNYNMYYGQQDPGNGPDNMLNSQEYMDLQWLVYENDQLNGTVDKNNDGQLDMESHPIYGPSNADPTFPSWGADTKWFDKVFSSAMIMNHDLSLSGGNDNSKFYAGLSYFQQDGVVIENWWKRISGRFNSEFKIKDRVTIGENVNITFRTDNGISNNGDEGTAMLMGVYRSQAIIPVIWENGTYVGQNHTFEDGDWGGTGIAPRLGNGNNYVANQSRGADDKWQDIRLLGNVFLDVKILEGLNVKTLFGGTYGTSYFTNWTGSTYENAENTATASYYESSNYGSDWNWTNTVTYNKSFDKHNLLVVGGYEAIKTEIGRGLDGQRNGYTYENYVWRTISNGQTLGQNTTSYYSTPRTLTSLFVRADYNYQSKYYVSATVRRDGASVFGQENKYGTFPSFTVAWRLSEESFLTGSSFFSDLKLRGGWGKMGSQFNVSPLNQYSLIGGGPGSSNYDIGGTQNTSVQGFRPTRIGNESTKWEENITTNVGIDAAFFNNKLELVLDWYLKETEDLIFSPELPAHIVGGADIPAINIGAMTNTGIDVQLIYKQNWDNFRLSANAQITSYNNEINEITPSYPFFPSGGGTRIGDFNRNQVGHSMGEFFGYQVERLFQENDFELNDEDKLVLTDAPLQAGAEPGVFKFANVSTGETVESGPDAGRQEITTDDRTFIGTPHPDFTYGLNLDLGWKNFDLSAFFYGSQGNDIFNYNKWWLDFWPSFQGQKSKELLYDSWTPTNTDTNVPKATNSSTFSTNTQSNSYYLEDASYFRLKSLQIGYTFPKTFLGNVFTNARIYVQGTNLFTITGYSGLDPELASFDDTFQGVDEGSLPTMKQYLLGVNLGF